VNGVDIWVTDPEAAPENNVLSFVVSTVGVEEAGRRAMGPVSLTVHPNPFTEVTEIAASTGDPATASVHVFDQSGRQVATLGASSQTGAGGGRVFFRWRGLDDDGRPVPSGTYFAVLGGQDDLVRSHVAKLVKIE
jgi:flagellar hook assembly protein FlgD